MFLVHPWPDPLEGNDVPWSGRIEKAQFLDPYQLVQTPSATYKLCELWQATELSNPCIYYKLIGMDQ